MIIQNAICITEDHPEEKYLVSSHVHDFREYVLKNGTTLFVDGGNDYIRRGGSAYDTLKGYGVTWMEWCLDDKEPFDTIKDRLLWGTRGKSGREPLRYVRLVTCETEHLQSILQTQIIGKRYRDVIESILVDRDMFSEKKPRRKKK